MKTAAESNPFACWKRTGDPGSRRIEGATTLRLQAAMSEQIAVTTRFGAMLGRTTWRKSWPAEQPSIRAASSSSDGMRFRLQCNCQMQ